jgi:hypothetical protein
VRHQVSHPYKTTGKTTVLYTLIFVFLYLTYRMLNRLLSYLTHIECNFTFEICELQGYYASRAVKNFITLEDEIDTLSRNVGQGLKLDDA